MGSIHHHHFRPIPPSARLCTEAQSMLPRVRGLSWLTNAPNHQILVQRKAAPLRPLQALNTSSLFLSLNSPASSGDLSVLLPVSAVLFLVYWLANFVVPNIISKDFEMDETDEEQTPEK